MVQFRGWGAFIRESTQISIPFANDAIALRSWESQPNLPKVLFIHGGSGSWLHWLPVLPLLHPVMRILAVDLPGFGASRNLRPSCIADVVEGLRIVIEQHGSDLDAIVAFSFGATVSAIALDRLSTPPDLHVLAPGGWGPTAISPTEFRPRPPGLSAQERFLVDQHNLSVAMMPKGKIADGRATRLYRCALKQATFDSRPFSFSREFENRIQRLPLRSALWAQEDRFMKPDLSRRIGTTARYHPDAPQRSIPGAGHWLQYEAPQKVAEWLFQRICQP